MNWNCINDNNGNNDIGYDDIDDDINTNIGNLIVTIIKVITLIMMLMIK